MSTFLLTSFFFVCIPLFHSRINVLITFGKTLVLNGIEWDTSAIDLC
jgi:hypothetical protein